MRAELLAHAPEGIAPGQPLWLGLSLTHQPGWHTYWLNSGDSGLPTELSWSLPAGLQAGRIAWPAPQKISIGPLANYGYEGTVLLPVPVAVGPDFSSGLLQPTNVTVRLHAAWLVCNKECIPEEGDFSITVPARSSTALHSAMFDAAFAAQPQDITAGAGKAEAIPEGFLHFSMPGLPPILQGQVLDFFPETPNVIEAGAVWTQAWQDGVWTARIPLSSQRSANPPLGLPVVFAYQGKGWRTELPVAGNWPALAAPPAVVSPALESALRANAAQSTPSPASIRTGASFLAWAAALAGALLGGLILNLMPCVFPVLAIKVVGFASHGQDRRAHRMSGLAYTAGVVLSFIALGALMLGLRAAGQSIGWGFQLQSPAVVAGLAALFTLVALNLAGVFEFGRFLPSSLASLQLRHPAANSFLTGVLAVAVASPCTAPFMGASLGLTAMLPTAQALAIFAALGLGLALPYLAASWIPTVARSLPRPGAWMVTLRKFMAFPMLATVVWLVWVLGQQSGIDGAGALLALLVVLGMAVWSLSLMGRARWMLGSASVALLVILGWALGPVITSPRPAAQVPASADTPWQPWVPGLAEQLAATGRPVFVDFTAAWCITCQYNKKTVLTDPKVVAAFQAKHVALVRADWTRQDPAITTAITALGRSGVPLYVLYRPGHGPALLPEVLTVDEVLVTIERL